MRYQLRYVAYAASKGQFPEVLIEKERGMVEFIVWVNSHWVMWKKEVGDEGPISESHHRRFNQWLSDKYLNQSFDDVLKQEEFEFMPPLDENPPRPKEGT